MSVQNLIKAKGAPEAYNLDLDRHVSANAEYVPIRYILMELLALFANSRIEMQILSLHWMMQNIRLFYVCEARRASGRYYKLFCTIQCMLDICISLRIVTFYSINHICHTILHPAPLVTLLK